MEIGTSVAAAALADLTDELVRYRLQEIERQQTNNRNHRKVLTPDEIKEAKAYLSAPNLMQRTMEDIGRASMIGEETIRLFVVLHLYEQEAGKPFAHHQPMSVGVSRSS